jgi:molecular chaperone DnaJ
MDPYALLGVGRDATQDDIKRAYRRLARELHPDANPGDAAAEERFKEITRAYELIGDPEKRRRYDTFGDTGGMGGAGGPGDPFGFGDIFEAFFGGGGGGFGGGRSGPARAPDAEAVIDLDLVEAAFGVTKRVEVDLATACEACTGSGCAAGTHPERCGTCGGAGEVRQVRRSILGQIVTAAPCSTCRGLGTVVPQPCTSCSGSGIVRGTRTLEVEVPRGIDSGQRLRLSGRGPAAPRGGAPGDLYVTVRVRPHPTLRREGNDLVQVCRIPMTGAALGTTLTIGTLEGELEIEVPAGTQHGTVFRERGQGVPVLQGRGRGDLLVQIDVEIPQRLSEEEAEVLRNFAAIRGEEITDAEEHGFFSRLRSAFQ